MKTITIKVLIITLFAAVFTSPVYAEVRLASWNIKRLNDSNKNLESVVKILSYFDFIAVQEVMDPDAMVALVTQLQETTNDEWGIMNSHLIGRGTYKEAYSFVWRKSAVDYVDSAVVYLDNRDVFAREPLSARFKTVKGDETFIVANIHILYGNSKSDRVPEIIALRKYWDWLSMNFPNEQYFLMGDFNMHPNEDAFAPLREVAVPLITEGATTLSKTTGRYTSLYDNIWVPDNLSISNLKSDVLRFPDILNITHAYARKSVSDHAPVYFSFSSFNEESGLYNAVPYKGSINGEVDSPEKETLFVRANERSKIYHIPDCGSYNVMVNSNHLIEFATEKEAVRSGYRKAYNCE